MFAILKGLEKSKIVKFLIIIGFSEDPFPGKPNESRSSFDATKIGSAWIFRFELSFKSTIFCSSINALEPNKLKDKTKNKAIIIIFL